MNMVRGFKANMESIYDISQSIGVDFSLNGPSVYDVCCFGVDTEDKLSHESYMVFYNQKASPNNEIIMRSESPARFELLLNKLPLTVNKLVFTINIDGSQNMGMLNNCCIKISQFQREDMVLTLTGGDFQLERAIIAIEMYRKNGWRVSAVARGFNGGLSELLMAYGGVEAVDSPAPSPQPLPAEQSKISLEKKLESGAPKLVSLAKPLKISLEKNNLAGVVARVALVLDISGSMTRQYKEGTVQLIVNKTLPLAVQFDDDGELDFWYYGSTCRRMESVNMRNYEAAVPVNFRELMSALGGSNYEPAVMREIIDEYKNSKIPAYIIFITDGGVGNKRMIEKLIIESSEYPIFWEFVGIGGRNYGVLEKLDTLKGRKVDNANFFALDDFRTVADDELYDRLLNEFPVWLKEAKRLGIMT